MDSVSAFRIKLDANDLSSVDVPLNPAHSLTDGVYDRWSDIMGFSRNRKLFVIDTTLSVKPFQFQLVSIGIVISDK